MTRLHRLKVVIVGSSAALALMLFMNLAPFRGKRGDLESWPVIGGSWQCGYLEYGWPVTFLRRVDLPAKQNVAPTVFRNFRPLAFAGNAAFATLVVAIVGWALARWQKRGFRFQLGLKSLLIVTTACALGVAGWVASSNALSRNLRLQEESGAYIQMRAPVPRCIEESLGIDFFDAIRLVRPQEITVFLDVFISESQFAAAQELVRLYPSLVQLDIDSEVLQPIVPVPGVAYRGRFGEESREQYVPPLEAMSNVEHIRLTCEGNEPLLFLRELPRLRSLTVHVRPPIIQELGDRPPRLDLGFIDALPELRSVQITWRLRDGDEAVYDGLAVLGEMKRIENLCLTHAVLSAADLAAIARCETLRTLLLYNCQIDNENLHVLARLPLLRTLALVGSGITDRGVQELQTLTHLEQLCLDGQPITHAGLLELQNNKALRFLSVNGTRVTPDGIQQLRNELPGLWVRMGGPVGATAFPSWTSTRSIER